MIRWMFTLQQFDFAVSHCVDKDNIVADFFSRNPRGKFETIQPRNLSIDVLGIGGETCIIDSEIGNINLESDIKSSLRNLAVLQENDPNIKIILYKVAINQNVEFYVFEQGILFHRNVAMNRWQVVIPSEITDRLIDCIHSKLGHPGIYKTLMYVKQYFFWKGMNREIKKYILSCDLCQRVKNINV